MRSLCVAAAASVGLACGCTGFDFVPQPPPHFLGVETWTDVTPGQVNVSAKVGDVFYLPIHFLPSHVDPDNPILKVALLEVSVNGVVVAGPTYHTSSKTVSYVFRAEKVGTYRVEVAWARGESSFRAWNIAGLGVIRSSWPRDGLVIVRLGQRRRDPHSYRPVDVRAGQPLAVGRPGHAVDYAYLFLISPSLLPRLEVPDFHP